jgi:hypothetical protein
VEMGTLDADARTDEADSGAHAAYSSVVLSRVPELLANDVGWVARGDDG